MKRSRFLGGLGLCIVLASAAPVPCLWDYDTLVQEQARFPSALELMTGHFPRHSEAYYRWRIEDREARRVAGESTPEIFDDLSVAWDKLGEQHKALALMDEKEELFPGLYETAANRGTFLIHSGRFEKGRVEIARAIEINPEAHFGREVYQHELVRYVIESRADGRTGLPLNEKLSQPYSADEDGFFRFLLNTANPKEGERAAVVASASKGILGMLRFGQHDSPILLEALSDVFLGDRNTDARRLATRALLKASYETDNTAAKQLYREKAAAALSSQTPSPKRHEQMTLDELELRFTGELQAARAWHAELASNELSWIEAGENVDARFTELYLQPASADAQPAAAISSKSKGILIAVIAAALWLVTVIAAQRKRQARAQAETRAEARAQARAEA